MNKLSRWTERRWRKDPRCAWCRRVTVLWRGPPRDTPKNDPRRRPPLNAATVDHLRDRFDPTRQEPIIGRPQVRRVLACWECNWARNVYREAQQPIEELWRRSGKTSRASFHRAGCPLSAPEPNGGVCACWYLAQAEHAANARTQKAGSPTGLPGQGGLPGHGKEARGG